MPIAVCANSLVTPLLVSLADNLICAAMLLRVRANMVCKVSLFAVIRKVSELDVKPHHNPCGISRGQSEVVDSRDTVLVRLGLFGQSNKLALLKRSMHVDAGQVLQNGALV
jgi:hypothetical protein